MKKIANLPEISWQGIMDDWAKLHGKVQISGPHIEGHGNVV